MNGPSRELRSSALQKIARLSTSSSTTSHGSSDFDKLYGALKSERSTPLDMVGSSKLGANGAALSKTPMTVEEIHVLLALCKAAPQVEELHDAERLLGQLTPYLLEAHEQAIVPSPFLKLVEQSPWEALSNNLVAALLSLGIRHPSLHGAAYDCILRYIENCSKASNMEASARSQPNGHDETMKSQRSFDTIVLLMSILGFMEAAAKLFHVFNVSQRLEVVRSLRMLLSDDFLVGIEGALSSIRNSEPVSKVLHDLKSLTKRYASSGRPLGAMLLQENFLRLLVSCGSLQIETPQTLQHSGILDHLMSLTRPEAKLYSGDSIGLAETLAEIASDAMRLLEDGADYLELGSVWQQRLAFKCRGYAIVTFLSCMLVDEDIADTDLLMSWLENAMADPIQIADADLACVILKSLAIVAKTSPAIAAALSRSLPRFVVQGGLHGSTIDVAAHCLASILQVLSQDAMITGLYTLGNVLSAGNTEKGLISSNLHGAWAGKNSSRYTQHSMVSAITLDVNGIEETSAVYANVVRVIVLLALSSADKKVLPLAQSMLIQKLGRISASVDFQIIVETAALGAVGEESELKSLLKLYDRLGHDGVMNKKHSLLEAVRQAHTKLIEMLDKESPSFQLYLLHIFETVVGKGDIHGNGDSPKDHAELPAEEIAQLLRPLALLAPYFKKYGSNIGGESTAPLQREIWFNIAVHGIIPGSTLWQKHLSDLRELAVHSQPLIAEDRTDHLESDIELNTVLRRGMSGPHTAEMKKNLIRLLPAQESQIRSLAYSKVIFLHAAYSVETLRAEAGVCAEVLSYFIDPSVNQDGTALCMMAIADEVMARFFGRMLGGNHVGNTAPLIAIELAKVLGVCCHRIPKCQQVAASFADKLVAQAPSSLCQKSSLYALLELLTLMWSSCLGSEIDEYEWKSSYVSPLGGVSLELSDDFEHRKRTLRAFHKRAKGWVLRVINVSPLDVKGLLQTYLSEYEDEGAYGHVSLGRSFALEMGAAIPRSDQRLGAIDRFEEMNIDTASDFIVQYTTRQEYKYADATPEYDQDWTNLLQSSHERDPSASRIDENNVEDVHAILTVLDRRISAGKYISIGELRDLLRRAVALVCRSHEDQCAIVHDLVSIPFSLLTKQSIQLGISLWLGIINENSFMESRVLTEILKNWEASVRKKLGAFSTKLIHIDPFYSKEEYAPTDKAYLLKRQHASSNIIAPHLRILQFLSSHFNAYRLGSLHLRKAFQRMMMKTLHGLRQTPGHPLAREFHFQVILFALSMLRYSDDLSISAKWRFKDRILSAGLSWYSHAPRWSFGGNRLQIKAECQLLMDVESAVSSISAIASETKGTLQSLSTKQELLVKLLEHEYTRLQVWLFPTLVESRGLFTSHRGDKSQLSSITSAALRTSWSENPSLAIQIAIRSQSLLLLRELRAQLLAHAEKAIDEPEALSILLPGVLSNDVSHQLKYLLYWSAVNPISVVTYFLPEYRNHPFVLQYAMRALDSHPVDITFFYVPQIVQTLRYDALGYVQRYIIETAKISQLFAHQIIWNMKANAYKDEESTEEDPLKPTLDIVSENMISHFTATDKAFYEKEFDFFNEVTGISGKLRPYIKKEKAEKKQKIEEELRQIKVEVGVYLPSNPDGVVIGIDRKSGKPLQSHAKAPYMATFRIRRNKGEMEGTEELLESANQNPKSLSRGSTTQETTYDVWQSAIFKVGDDCRQDVLALQMVAAFRNIFNNVGLDVWVYPYRVTATAPGCGVIDVLPNSISRDMLGREAVNGLYDYFVSKYGGEDSIRFQEARNNFVKSMAAYSVISYLLQFKDRHNGNIMIDDAGHIIHIDFGFCFDIAPGGVKFERAPFKLTSEMVAVMGGDTSSQSYKWFEELCIKAFLASRPYTEKLSHMVVLMLDSGLPCFKPETITHFKERFVLAKSEREAAEFMKELVRKSHNSYSTRGYDQFQLMTNGIPY